MEVKKRKIDVTFVTNRIFGASKALIFDIIVLRFKLNKRKNKNVIFN
jgi:hypothetical protein